jgi:hypothetical protein
MLTGTQIDIAYGQLPEPQCGDQRFYSITTRCSLPFTDHVRPN